MKMKSAMKTTLINASIICLFASHMACATMLSKPPAFSPGIISAHLRGASGAPKCKDGKPCQEYEHEAPLPRGHFYYAKSCADCVYQGAECGCGPALEYFACKTQFCHPSNETAFAEECASISSKCYFDIDLRCRAEHTDCQSKFNQKPAGGVGLRVDVVEDNAFCGPYGKCIGHLHFKIQVQNRPKPQLPPAAGTTLSMHGPGPAPAIAAAAPSPGPAALPVAAPPAPAAAPMWVECGLPAVDKPEVDRPEDWITCQNETADGRDEAECEIPLPAEWIKAEEKDKVYCVLTDGEKGERLTVPAWRSIFNAHEVNDAGNAAVHDAEAKEEDVKDKQSKETKDISKDSKAEDTKQAAKEKKTEEPKKAEQATVAKEADEKANSGKQSSLPWMAGKKSDKPPPPWKA